MENENCSRCCLLYTSDAADERSSVDLGGRRIIKKKKRMSKDGVVKTQYTTKSIYDQHKQGHENRTKKR